MSLLDGIKKSSDLRELDEEQLAELIEEIRQDVISVVSQNGGHLASNLGIVELTMALHMVFDIPTDQIVWDVGHQCYVHKILSGRRDELHTIRKYKGISGFPRRGESEADPFGAGHASTSISAALGLATARDRKGLDHEVIAVIGDGALSGGLSFEGLNNAGASKRNLLVVVNDNEMSISKNVGALSKYLTHIMTDRRFNKLRDEIWELTGRFKRRDKIRAMVSDIEKSIKGLFVPGYFFDNLGFRYFGPIDGHDLGLLRKTLTQIKNISGPRLLHIVTTKGKGFAPAEANATKFHGIGSFDKITGETSSKSSLPAYTNVFGETMLELAEKDERIVAITAAMSAGTGLTKFSEKYPDRFFDVGIAEGHATCFASGMAAGGLRPYVAIYSTFLQRAYDQIIHDAALQDLPVVFCIDRAGLVGDDGPTHHGCFDLSYLSAVPNMTILAPADGDELRSMLHAVAKRELDGPCAVRYPRGAVPYPMTHKIEDIPWGKWRQLEKNGEVVVIASGTMCDVARRACEKLRDVKETALINTRFIKPLDTEMLDYCMKTYRHIITIEENAFIGGLGQMVGSYLAGHEYKGGYHSFAIPDKFISQGTRKILLDEIGLDVDTLVEYIEGLNHERKTILEKLHLKKGVSKNGAIAVNGNYRGSSDK